MTKTLISLVTLLIITTANAQENTMKNLSSDEAAIASIVESVAVFADRAEFDALSRLYADEFTLDYSSLNGQDPTTKKPLQLMQEWAAVLPGFDRTRHAISDVEVDVSGKTATARANVTASHWIADLFWQVEGQYAYNFIEADDQWKITSMTFNLENETGTRDVFAPAIEAAKSKALPGNKVTIAERNKERVRTLFSVLENEDIPTFVDLFAENGSQINPYNAGIFPKGAKGKEELLAYWTPVPTRFDGMQFMIEEILATEDPYIVFVRYRGEIKLKDNAGTYANNYYSTFRFNKEGKITEYVEIFDPVVAARGFGLLDQLK
ncbi:MAG: nuclear transport factor 2 family protein [Pseudomonadota bacterium]